MDLDFKKIGGLNSFLEDYLYQEYCNRFKDLSPLEDVVFDSDPMTKILFVDKVKSNKISYISFSTRRLTFEERHKIWDDENKKANVSEFLQMQLQAMLDRENVPTQLVTIIYNNENFRFYE